jgi:hypothetical protein
MLPLAIAFLALITAISCAVFERYLLKLVREMVEEIKRLDYEVRQLKGEGPPTRFVCRRVVNHVPLTSKEPLGPMPSEDR